MHIKQNALCLIAAFMLLLLQVPATGQVTVDPMGIAAAIEIDDSLTVEVTLANGGEDDVAFSIGFDLIVDEEDRRGGPRRDDLGDVIETYEVGEGLWYGLGWDGERMVSETSSGTDGSPDGLP